ncbi:Atrial natriuretic peptide receptor 1, partial [Hypsibius exemplaris]
GFPPADITTRGIRNALTGEDAAAVLVCWVSLNRWRTGLTTHSERMVTSYLSTPLDLPNYAFHDAATVSPFLGLNKSGGNMTSLGPFPIPTTDIMPEYHLVNRSNAVFNVTILVVATFGGVLPIDLRKSGGIIELAVQAVRTEILPDVNVFYHMVSKSDFSDCYQDENHAAYLMSKFAFGDVKTRGYPPVGLVVGPGCTKALESTGRIAADSKIPMVTSQGFSLTLDDKTIFRTLTRTGPTMKTLSRFALQFLDTYNYTNVAIIYDDLFSFFSVVGSMFYRAFYYRQGQRMFPLDLPYRNVTDFTTHLYQAANNSRVIFVLAKGSMVRQIMLQAFDLGMTDGEFVFVTCEWYKEKYWGSYSWRVGDSRDQDAHQAFRTLFILREGRTRNRGAGESTDTEVAYQNLVRKAKSLDWNRFGYNFDYDEDISPAVIELYDGIILWATALNETLRFLEDPRDGLIVTRRMWARQLDGINGSIRIDANGDRDCGYAVLDMAPGTGDFKVVFTYAGHGEPLEVVRTIDWGEGRMGSPPNEPECGYKGDRLVCLMRNESGKVLDTAVGVVAGLVLLFLVIGFLIYRKVKMEQALRNTWWRVDLDEVKFQGRANSTKSMSLVQGSETQEAHKLSVARYHERYVMVKSLDCKIDLSRDFLIYLSKLNTINHENVNRIVGLCPEINHEAIIMEYCAKGGLVDILEKEDMELDWGFKSSLISDLVSGLEYIHSSFLQSHGNLHSSNCVIDSRFTLKITDYAFPELRNISLLPVDAVGQDINYKALLWRAPEFLRTVMPPAGSSKGDVFSMAIILCEIVTRREPYSALDSTLDRTYVEIIDQVRYLDNPPFRPSIGTEECPPLVAKVIQMCWAEQPKDRLTVKDTQRLLKENGVEKGSVMDNVIKRMEHHAVNLESTVNDRTRALLDEKRKVEELLYEILPRAVADALKRGMQVPPEAFEMVTIYYSDIVGFTTISARSTAFQVVDLLNDLYTLFDGITLKFDAYKVETIGDAYVIASGVPIRNGDRHAFEIAGLALAFREGVADFIIRHIPDEKLMLRIGLHSGYCAAGVVGVKMPRYCLFGESVQMANKMESTGEAEKIQISEVTKKLLDQFNAFEMTYRHDYYTGKGTIATYWLVSRMLDHLCQPKSPRGNDSQL